jgi:hypothetical protein
MTMTALLMVTVVGTVALALTVNIAVIIGWMKG